MIARSTRTLAAKRVVIFDSGVGGLSIYGALHEARPDLEYLFVSDNEAHPYGTKCEDELVPRVIAVMRQVIDQFEPDLVVVACNTASTVALPALREAFDVPFVGVVPAIKPAAQLTKTKSIAVIATPATIARPYTQTLIEEFAAACKVVKIGSSTLVELAEQKLAGNDIELADLHRELEPILANDDIDTIVLACTHFPLLINEIKDFLDLKSNRKDIRIIDSGAAIARRVSHLLPDSLIDSDPRSGAWMTASISQSSELQATLQRLGLSFQGILKI